MKRFFEVMLYSASIPMGGFWILIPLFFGLSLICRNCGAPPIWAERISLIVVTASVVGIGAVACEDGFSGAKPKSTELQKQVTELTAQNSRLQGQNITINVAVQRLLAECRKLSTKLEENRGLLNKLENDTSQSCPWLATKVTDILALADADLVLQMRTKRNPAIKAADQVQAMAKERREALRRCKEAEYQLQFYEGLFPWLEEFKTVPAPEAVSYVHSTDSNYDEVRNRLSPEEYETLSSAEKNQLALDRYIKRKSQIGM